MQVLQSSFSCHSCKFDSPPLPAHTNVRHKHKLRFAAAEITDSFSLHNIALVFVTETNDASKLVKTSCYSLKVHACVRACVRVCVCVCVPTGIDTSDSTQTGPSPTTRR